jgi:hypothetical protein
MNSTLHKLYELQKLGWGRGEGVAYIDKSGQYRYYISYLWRVLLN